MLKNRFVFGPDGGVMRRCGNMTFLDDGASYRDVGHGHIFGPNGTLRTQGDLTFRSGAGGGLGDVIRRSGNTWFGPKGRYVLQGTMLFGPHGECWRGVQEADVAMIIDSDS